MEKCKKPFLIISGVLKCLCSGLLLLFAGVIFLLKDLLKSVMKEMGTAVSEFVTAMVEMDPVEYAFLQAYTDDQVLDYMMGTINTVGWLFLIMGIIILTFAILTFVISKNGGYLPMGKRITFTIVMLATTLLFSLSNILTVVALFTGNGSREPKKVEENKDIPHYEIS